MAQERDDLVYLAKLAEQAERFDEMVERRRYGGAGGLAGRRRLSLSPPSPRLKIHTKAHPPSRGGAREVKGQQRQNRNLRVEQRRGRGRDGGRLGPRARLEI